MKLGAFSVAVALAGIAAGACTADPLEGTEIDCDPMAYQIDNQVWVLQDGETARLSEEGLIAANPAVSPDGASVAYTSGEDERSLDLFVTGLETSERRLVWAGDSEQSAADWSPDGSAMVFDEWVDERGTQVFTIQEGSEPVQLTSGEANAKPKWTPDGESIVFLSLRDGPAQEIYLMTRDGSDQVNLTNHPAVDVLAEMSPDGRNIAFVSDRAGNMDIWLMGPDGANPRQLTNDPERDTNPTWSTDGSHIIFRSDRDPVGLWYMTPDGADQQPLLGDGWLASCP